jgi:hypothetical protein
MNYYLEENVIKTEEHEHGDYKLIIKTYNTSKVSGSNTWEYTEGFVYNKNVLMGSIKRNYARFPYCFFEHYLVSGRSYMRQTIIDCENGQIYDNTDDPEAGDFCWDTIYYMKNTLIVLGCYWGASYEYCFFDVSDVSKGWSMLSVDPVLNEKCYLDYGMSSEASVVNNILTIIYGGDYDDNDNDNDDELRQDLVLKLKRENNIIKLIDITFSDVQKVIEDEKEIK